ARVERVASRANLDVQWLVHRRARRERIAAAAGDLDFRVLGMNVRFHDLPLEGSAARQRVRRTGVQQRGPAYRNRPPGKERLSLIGGPRARLGSPWRLSMASQAIDSIGLHRLA